MKSLIHPHIIRLYEVSAKNNYQGQMQIKSVSAFFSSKVMESKNLIYLVTEYAANGELLGE